MVFSRSSASKGRDSYPLVPEGPTTLEWLAGENISLRAKIEELNAALQQMEEQMRVYAAEREEAQQEMVNYYDKIAQELKAPFHHLMSRAEAIMSNSPASQDENCLEVLVALCNEIRKVTEQPAPMVKFPAIGDPKG